MDAPAAAPLIFSFDVVCPYACLALFEVEALAARLGLPLVVEPVLLGGLFRAQSAPDQPAAGWSVAKARHGALDITRQAHVRGQAWRLAPGHPRRSVEAMRLVIAANPDQRMPLARALAQAYHGKGQDLSDRAVLAPIGAAFGVDIAQIDAPEVKDELRANTERAAAAGAFGVPTLRHGERLWWGVDRFAAAAQAISGEAPDPLPARPGHRRRLTVVFDLASPFAHVGLSVAQRVAEKHGVELILWPVLLGALFRSIGTPDVPLFAMAEAKRAWTGRDLFEQAAQQGVPLQFSSHFPVRTVLPLRVLLDRPDLAVAMSAAVWTEDQDLGDPAVLAAWLRARGEDAEALLAAAEAPEVKARLRASNARAEEAGVFGVPTWIVDDGPPIWGVDRLPLVERALAGLELGPVDAFAEGGPRP
ncbi:MAG: hypothetical protein RL071_1300 [Pseudomonadota bacterium]